MTTKRGIGSSFLDLDVVFESVSEHAIVVNDLDPLVESDRLMLEGLLLTSYKGDVFDDIPVCMCGGTEDRLGVVCIRCGTECVSVTERVLSKRLWVRTPDGVHNYMTPDAWNYMSIALKANSFDVMEWAVNKRYQYEKNDALIPDMVHHLVKHGWVRSLNHLYENFEFFVDAIEEYRYSFSRISTDKDFVSTVRANKNKFFTKHLLIPDKVLMIKEETSLGSFVNTAITKAVDSVRSVTGLKTRLTTNRSNDYEAFTIMSALAKFASEFTDKVLAGKPGIYRKQINGLRSDFSGRALITSITKPHSRHEMAFPYLMGVAMMTPFISSAMETNNVIPGKISRYLANPEKYIDIIGPYLDLYIEQSQYGFIPSMLGRNPTLKHGSLQGLLVSINYDLDDPTIKLPISVVRQLNADFDGDELYVRIAMDNREGTYMMEFLNVDNTIVSHAKPRTLHNTAGLFIQNAGAIAKYLKITDKESGGYEE